MFKSSVVLILLSIFLTSCAGNAKADMIIPGSSVGKYVLNETTRESVGEDEEGVFLTFNEGKELTGIFVTSTKYKTDKGLAVGDSSDKVLEIYGDSDVQSMDIEKSGTVIGSMGDSLSYPGIKFVINDGVISGIVVLPKQ